jgi:competence protein ComEA
VEQSSTPWRVFDAPSANAAPPAAGSPPTPGPRAGLNVPPLAIAGIGAALLIGAFAVFLAIGGNAGAVADGPTVSSDPGSTSFGAGPGGAELVVDVTGAVVTPGVYHLAPGSRINDAIDAAGGFSARVDAERVAAVLNLAAALTDGQQVRVPSRDDAAGETGGGPAASSGPSTGRIDINTATEAELESLPGIGPVTAGKIIEARAQARFRTIDELRERGLVGEKTFETIKALVTAS